MSWLDDPTMAQSVRERLLKRFDDAEWFDAADEATDEETLEADIGLLTFSIYVHRDPVGWRVSIPHLEELCDEGSFTSQGDASTIESAKVVGMSYAFPLLDKGIRFLVGDITEINVDG